MYRAEIERSIRVCRGEKGSGASYAGHRVRKLRRESERSAIKPSTSVRETSLLWSRRNERREKGQKEKEEGWAECKMDADEGKK